jgi:hypothetical protein
MSEHNHEGGLDENIRMDILKVNQKVFNQYPVGSQERLVCVRNKKLMELEAMTAAINNMPAESVSMVSTMNAHLVIFALLRAGLCSLLLAGVPLYWRWVGNWPGRLAISCLAGSIVMLLVENVTTAWRIFWERKQLLDAYESLRAKFDGLIRDLEQLK